MSSIASIVINRGPRGIQGPPGVGVELGNNLEISNPTPSALRFRLVGPDMVTRSLTFVMAELDGPEAPELSSIETYRTSSTSWVGVPWGDQVWVEPGIGTQQQLLDIDIPAGTPPAGGWPVIFHLHANAATRTVAPGSALDVQVKQPGLAAGYAFVSGDFRHPVVQAAVGAPHQDAGLMLQYLRSLHSALNIDRTRVHALCRSRGSLALWQSLQADLADADAATYAARQSSIFTSLWVVQGQIAYSTTRFAELYIVPGDRAAVVAANPDNPAWRNTIDAVPTAASLPPIAMVHELAWYGAQVTKATMDADGSQVHFPDAGRLMVAAYTARGQGSRCAAWDAEPSTSDNAEQLGDAPNWFKFIDEGMSATEALAMARARRRNAQAHYVTDNLAGAYQTAEPLAGTPVLAGPVGALVCGQYGLANRVAATPSGNAAAQLVSANRPLLAQFGSGRYGLLFDSTDRLAVAMASDGTIAFRGWTDTGEVTDLVSTSTSNYVFGTTAFAGKTVGLVVGQDAATFSANDLKIYRRFATQWTGRAYP